jgi:hypothetical protein
VPAVGCRPAPVLPVTPETNRRGSTRPSDSSGTLASSIAVAKAARMRDVRRVQGVEVLGHRAGELRETLRRAVGVLVDRLVRGRARKRKSAEMSTTRGCVPACSLRRAACRSWPRTRRGAPPRTRRSRVGGDVLDHLVVAGEAQVRQHRLQVTEELRDRLVGLAVRSDGREVEVRCEASRRSSSPAT